MGICTPLSRIPRETSNTWTMASSRSSTRVVTKCKTNIKTTRKDTITWEITTKINGTSMVSSKTRTNTTTITIDMGTWITLQEVLSLQASKIKITSVVIKGTRISSITSTCKMATNNATTKIIWWTRSTTENSERIIQIFLSHRFITLEISTRKIQMPSMIPWINRWEDMVVTIWVAKAINITIREAIIDTTITITWMDTAWMVTGRTSNMILIEAKKIFKPSVLTTSTKNQNQSVDQTSRLHCAWNSPSQRRRQFVY